MALSAVGFLCLSVRRLPQTARRLHSTARRLHPTKDVYALRRAHDEARNATRSGEQPEHEAASRHATPRCLVSRERPQCDVKRDGRIFFLLESNRHVLCAASPPAARPPERLHVH